MYYTYVLLSSKDEKFYTGFTRNLKLRFEQHNKGEVESTKDRGPFNLPVVPSEFVHRIPYSLSATCSSK